jgi:hypothetical protein
MAASTGSADKTELESETPRAKSLSSEKDGAPATQQPAGHDGEAGGENSGDDATAYPSGLKLILIILSLCMCVFLVALDQTIIAPAIGTITADFKSVKDIGWYGSAYLLTTTALQPMYGTIYKLFNVKLAYLIAVFIFEIGSLITAVAPNSTVFIVGRAIAGVSWISSVALLREHWAS